MERTILPFTDFLEFQSDRKAYMSDIASAVREN